MAHDFSDSAAAAAGGERVTAAMRPTHEPYRLTPTPYFVLMHHPMGWEACQVAGEWVWLPRLKMLSYAPGTNGIRQGRGKGAPPDPTLALVAFQSRGWTIIPEDYDGGYVVRYPVAGGAVHLLRWATPRNVGNKTTVRGDDEAYKAFRLQLVTDGVIAPPVPEVIEDLLDRQRTRIGRAEQHIHIPAVARRLEDDTAKLSGMEAIA